MSQPLLFFDVNQTDARYTLMENRANTIRARYGTGGGQYAVCPMADEKITLTEKRFFKWYVDDISVSLRAKSGSYGGGSEVFIIEEKDGGEADLPKDKPGNIERRL